MSTEIKSSQKDEQQDEDVTTPGRDPYFIQLMQELGEIEWNLLNYRDMVRQLEHAKEEKLKEILNKSR